MDDSFASAIAHCNSISEVREASEKNPFVKESTSDSISPAKILLSNIFTRLKLGKGGGVFFSCSEMEELWNSLVSVDASANE